MAKLIMKNSKKINPNEFIDKNTKEKLYNYFNKKSKLPKFKRIYDGINISKDTKVKYAIMYEINFRKHAKHLKRVKNRERLYTERRSLGRKL